MNAEAWNREHPIGTEVVVMLDTGRSMVTKTRSVAWDMFAGARSVVLVDGLIPGCPLERVSPVSHPTPSGG